MSHVRHQPIIWTWYSLFVNWTKLFSLDITYVKITTAITFCLTELIFRVTKGRLYCNSRVTHHIFILHMHPSNFGQSHKVVMTLHWYNEMPSFQQIIKVWSLALIALCEVFFLNILLTVNKYQFTTEKSSNVITVDYFNIAFVCIVWTPLYQRYEFQISMD